MADINLMGAIFRGVPAVDLPKDGGGTARFHEVDGSQTVTENGTYDVTALAQMVVNVAGGGGGGLEYEEGTFEPTEDINRPTIYFSNTHTEAPVFAYMIDVTGTVNTDTYTSYIFMYFDFWRLYGQSIWHSSSKQRYAFFIYGYRQNNLSSISGVTDWCDHNSDDTRDTGTGYPRYWVTESEMHPSTGTAGTSLRYWRAGRTYKWVAVWRSKEGNE